MTHATGRGLDTPRNTADNWLDRAACRGLDLAVFFAPTPGTGSYDTARQVCRACPVTAECLQAALTAEGSMHHSHRFGVWGGLDPRERYQRWRCITGRCRHPEHRQEVA